MSESTTSLPGDSQDAQAAATGNLFFLSLPLSLAYPCYLNYFYCHETSCEVVVNIRVQVYNLLSVTLGDQTLWNSEFSEFYNYCCVALLKVKR